MTKTVTLLGLALGSALGVGCGEDEADRDRDGDGYLGLSAGGDDCNDRDPTVHPGQVEEDWQLEAIAEPGDTGHFTRIAVAPDGVVHVTFADLTAQTIVHASRGDGAWRTEVAVEGSASAHDLAIDPDGVVHLCYQLLGEGWSSSWLACGSSRDGGAWTFETVDEAGWTGVDPSLQVTPDGELHVAYGTNDADVVTLRHATNQGGAWTTEDVDRAGGHQASTALDGDLALHVAYVGVDGSILYATNAGGEWAADVVEAGPGLQGPTVVLGGDGTAHVAFDRGGNEVAWATRSGGSWTVESVTANPSGASPAVVTGVFDPLGSVHLFFPRTDSEVWGLGYATNLAGAWETDIVDLDSTGLYSAAIVHQGLLSVAYLGGPGSDGDALFAFRGAPDGVDSNCDGTAW